MSLWPRRARGKSDPILHLQIRDDAAEHRLNLVRILFPICDHVAAIPIARNSIIIVALSTHRGSPEAYGLQCLLQDYVQFSILMSSMRMALSPSCIAATRL